MRCSQLARRRDTSDSGSVVAEKDGLSQRGLWFRRRRPLVLLPRGVVRAGENSARYAIVHCPVWTASSRSARPRRLLATWRSIRHDQNVARSKSSALPGQ